MQNRWNITVEQISQAAPHPPPCDLLVTQELKQNFHTSWINLNFEEQR